MTSNRNLATQTREARAPAEVSDPAGPRVTVDRHADRLLVTIRRRQVRVFSLSLEEAAQLAAELHAQLAGSSR